MSWERKPPYQEVYWGDFFSSTMTMDPDAAKAYLFLLGRAWEDGGYLRDDDAWLARASRCSTRLWNKVKNEVRERFESDGEGRLYNLRLHEQIQQVNQKREKQKQNIEKRWAKKSNKINDGDHTDVSNRYYPPTPAPTPTVQGKDSELNQTKTEPSTHIRPSPAGRPRAVADEMVEIWNEICGGSLPQARKGSKARQPKLVAALRRDLGGDLDQWRAICHRVAASKFLTGATGWSGCGIDWVINATNMGKILEGNYDERQPPNGNGSPPTNGETGRGRNGRDREDITDVIRAAKRRVEEDNRRREAETGAAGRRGHQPVGRALDPDPEKSGAGGEQSPNHGNLGPPAWFEDEPIFDETGAALPDQNRGVVAGAGKVRAGLQRDRRA